MAQASKEAFTLRQPFPTFFYVAGDVIRTIMDFGFETILEITKIDLDSAFKIIPVEASAWLRQVLDFCNVIFIDNRLLFGDDLSAHTFVLFHFTMQVLFIFPFIKANITDLHLAVDDSTMVGPADTNMVTEYHQRYKVTVETLGLGMKKHDENLAKAYDPNRKGGQVLGVDLNLPDRTWFVSEVKRRDLSETVDEAIDPADYKRPIPINSNQLQRLVGLLTSFARLFSLGKSLMMVPVAEHNYFLEKLNHENEWPPHKQSKSVTFSLHARKNILFLRAILLESGTVRIPMEDDRSHTWKNGGAHIVVFTDASGKPKDVNEKDYAPTCLGLYRPRQLSTSQCELRCWVIPYCFLVGRDQYGQVESKNHHNVNTNTY